MKILQLIENIGKDIIKGAEIGLSIASFVEPQYSVLFKEIGVELDKLAGLIPTPAPGTAAAPVTLTQNTISQVTQAVTTMHVLNSLAAPAQPTTPAPAAVTK